MERDGLNNEREEWLYNSGHTTISFLAKQTKYTISSYLRGSYVEIGRMAVQGQPGEKVSKTPSQPTQAQWCIPEIPASWEA
jgi:hypothetical protein